MRTTAAVRGEARATGPVLPDDVDQLKAMTKAQLVALWPLLAGRGEPPPSQRSLLAGEIAWRTQARAHGGLDAPAARLLGKAVRAIEREADRIAAGGAKRAARAAPRAGSSARVRSASLPGSARLVRVWPAGSGTRHEVTVIESGRAYEYRGQRYASLTPIAREITGTHWSGPRFFGLTGTTTKSVAAADTEGRFSLSRDLKRSDMAFGSAGIAAFVEDPDTGEILQALAMSFCPG